MSKIMRNLGNIFVIAVIHFVLCRLVVFVTIYFNLANTGEGQTVPLLTRLLVSITRILYFPIVSLSLYTRQLFPGNWIFVPIFINSLLWGTVIFLIYRIWKKYTIRKSV